MKKYEIRNSSESVRQGHRVMSKRMFEIRIPVAATLKGIALILLTIAGWTVYRVYFEISPFNQESSPPYELYKCHVQETYEGATGTLLIRVYNRKFIPEGPEYYGPWTLIKETNTDIDGVGKALYSIEWDWEYLEDCKEMWIKNLTVWKCGIPPNPLLEISLDPRPNPKPASSPDDQPITDESPEGFVQ